MRELARAMRAAELAGLLIDRYEVDPATGKFSLYPKNESSPARGEGEPLQVAAE
jgi:hypothetical protein